MTMAGEQAVHPAVLVSSFWPSLDSGRPRITLVEKAIPFDLVEVNPAHQETPVFLVDGVAVHGSLNIVEYIEYAYPGMRELLPADPDERAQDRNWANYIVNQLPGCGSRLLNLQGDALMQARGDMVGIFQTLDWKLGDMEFFGGEHGFGFVDVALAPYTSSFLSYERYGGFQLEDVAPRVKAWQERIEARPSVIASWL